MSDYIEIVTKILFHGHRARARRFQWEGGLNKQVENNSLRTTAITVATWTCWAGSSAWPQCASQTRTGSSLSFFALMPYHHHHLFHLLGLRELLVPPATRSNTTSCGPFLMIRRQQRRPRKLLPPAVWILNGTGRRLSRRGPACACEVG